MGIDKEFNYEELIKSKNAQPDQSLIHGMIPSVTYNGQVTLRCHIHLS